MLIPAETTIQADDRSEMGWLPDGFTEAVLLNHGRETRYRAPLASQVSTAVLLDRFIF